MIYKQKLTWFDFTRCGRHSNNNRKNILQITYKLRNINNNNNNFNLYSSFQGTQGRCTDK